MCLIIADLPCQHGCAIKLSYKLSLVGFIQVAPTQKAD